MNECWILMEFDDPCLLGEVSFERIGKTPYDGTSLTLGRLPPRLISTMIGKLTKLTTS